MSKRFVDTEIWQKEWFQVLTLKEKILVKYIFENCDCAGMWNGNFRLASFVIGESVTLEELKALNDKKELFEFLPDGKIFILDFINFQYGNLSDKCKPHKPIISLLKKYGLFERVLKGYSKGIETLEEKEKEKEQEKEEEKEKEEIESLNFKNPDLMFDRNVEKVFNEYESRCKNCLPLKFEKRNLELRQEIFQFLQMIKFDFDYIAELCEKANELKSIYENPIDLKALIKNHERIFNGFYANAKSNGSKNTTKTGNKTLTPDEVLEKAGW